MKVLQHRQNCSFENRVFEEYTKHYIKKNTTDTTVLPKNKGILHRTYKQTIFTAKRGGDYGANDGYTK